MFKLVSEYLHNVTNQRFGIFDVIIIIIAVVIFGPISIFTTIIVFALWMIPTESVRTFLSNLLESESND